MCSIIIVVFLVGLIFLFVNVLDFIIGEEWFNDDLNNYGLGLIKLVLEKVDGDYMVIYFGFGDVN